MHQAFSRIVRDYLFHRQTTAFSKYPTGFLISTSDPFSIPAGSI
jgi:hypothetical protein